MNGPLEITGAVRLLLGLGTGILFGFLLEKGKVARYGTIIGQFLLKDFTVLKVMLSAVLVGAVGVHLMVLLDCAQLHVKPFNLGGILLGGILFGIGMALLGYCPGTAVAATGTGKVDALVGGVLGGLGGAWLHAHLYPLLKETVLAWKDFGKVTLDGALGVRPPAVILPLAIVALAVFCAVERAERARKKNP